MREILTESCLEKETDKWQLLDFASIPEYSPNGFVKAITPLSPNQSLNPGDQVAVDIARGKFTSTITVSIFFAPSSFPSSSEYHNFILTRFC